MKTKRPKKGSPPLAAVTCYAPLAGLIAQLEKAAEKSRETAAGARAVTLDAWCKGEEAAFLRAAEMARQCSHSSVIGRSPAALSPEQQRIIAHACGWTSESGVMRYDGEDIPWTVWTQDGKHCNNCPDYLNDLNACHEMEKVLTSAQQQEYAYQLEAICCPREYGYHATAAQRAEAFLRTLNLYSK